MTLVLGLFVAWFGFLLATLLFKSRPIASPWLFLLRSFFPNWRFFHALGRALRLYYRGGTDEDWTTWTRFMPRAERHWSHLLHNPQVNLALTEQNLVDHLASDVNECTDAAAVPNLVSYRMVERLVRMRIGEQVRITSKAFQFRICLEDPASSGFDDEDTLLLSPVLSL